MATDHLNELLASASVLEELLELAQARASTPKLHVLTLAGALAQAALEGDVPDSYVLDAVRSALAAAKMPDPTVN
jgi:hypothetical protein